MLNLQAVSNEPSLSLVFTKLSQSLDEMRPLHAAYTLNNVHCKLQCMCNIAAVQVLCR